MKTLGIMS